VSPEVLEVNCRTYCILGYDDVTFGTLVPTFRRTMLPSSCGNLLSCRWKQ